MKSSRLLIFDMDGVIVDVSASYRDTVRRAAGLFFKEAFSADELPDELFPLRDLARLKQRGGFNNDWDLTCRVIKLLFRLVKKPRARGNQNGWPLFRNTIKRCDVLDLARFLRTTDMPLNALADRADAVDEPFVSGLYQGEVGSGNVIKQIFQEIYLGRQLFESAYGIPAQLYFGPGLMEREKPLLSASFLAKLAGSNILAIATGRPRSEALHALDRFGLRPCFTYIYTLDDCAAEEQRISQAAGEKVSLSKPDPFMLDAIAEKSRDRARAFYYIGDMPDDMLAASRSTHGFIGVGFLPSPAGDDSWRNRMIASGAQQVIGSADELMELLGE